MCPICEFWNLTVAVGCVLLLFRRSFSERLHYYKIKLHMFKCWYTLQKRVCMSLPTSNHGLSPSVWRVSPGSPSSHQVDRSSGSQEARKVSELRSELWGAARDGVLVIFSWELRMSWEKSWKLYGNYWKPLLETICELYANYMETILYGNYTGVHWISLDTGDLMVFHHEQYCRD